LSNKSRPSANGGEAVPVDARRLGKSSDTIISAIRRGKLTASKGNDGEWRVWLPGGGVGKRPRREPPAIAKSPGGIRAIIPSGPYRTLVTSGGARYDVTNLLGKQR
jgi:hypothetical protein